MIRMKKNFLTSQILNAEHRNAPLETKTLRENPFVDKELCKEIWKKRRWETNEMQKSFRAKWNLI